MPGYKSYAKMSVQTADPRAVIVLLYEGMINFLNQAITALETDDRNGMSSQITKAQRIIHHLASALDFEKGGEVAQNLSKLYTYMRDTLSGASIHCDAAKIREVIELVRPLLDAWSQIAKDPAAAEAAQTARAMAAVTHKEEASEMAAPVSVSEPETSYAPAEETAAASYPAAGIADSAPKRRPSMFARMAGSVMAARPAQGFSESV